MQELRSSDQSQPQETTPKLVEQITPVLLNKESPDLEMLNLQIANQNDTSNLENNDNSMSSGNSIEQEEL